MNETHISADAVEVLNRLYSNRGLTNPLIVDSVKEADRFSACTSLMQSRLVTMQEIETMPRIWLVWPALAPLDRTPGPAATSTVRKKSAVAPEKSAERRESPAEAVERRLGWMRIPLSRVQFIPQEFATGTHGWLWQTPDLFHFSHDPDDCPASFRSSLKAAVLRERTVRFVWFSFDSAGSVKKPAGVLAALAGELAGETLDHGVEIEDGDEQPE